MNNIFANLTPEELSERANNFADLFAAQQANKAPEGPGAFRDPVTGTLYRIRMNKTTGSPYALVAPLGAKSFEYQRGAVAQVTEGMRLTYDEALQYSAQFNECVICGRALTDPKSVAKGIGPVCIKTIAGYVPPMKRARKTKAA